MDSLAIRVLGDVEIKVDGDPIDVDTRKAIALVVYLAVTGTSASRDQLCALLWSDLDPDRARGALRRTLSVLRKALGGRWLASESDRIRLAAPEMWLDIDEALRLQSSITDHGHEADALCQLCRQPLESAAALYRGEFMGGFSLRDSPDFEAWQLYEAEVIRHRHGAVLKSLADAAALRGEYPRAIAAARQRVILSPLDEAAHRQLMAVLVWSGDRAGALRQYRECVRILDDELGVPPLPETSELEERILCDDIPDPPGGVVADFVPESSRISRAERIELIGRSRELTTLRSLVMEPGGTVGAITGAPGVGKSRLADEVAEWALARQRVVVRAKAYEGEGTLGLVLIGEALRAALDRSQAPPGLDPRAAIEASRLVPSLAPAESVEPPPDPGGQSRFVDGVCTILASLVGEDGLLILDDLQWADSASIDLLSYLVRRSERFPIHSILIWRSSASEENPLRSVVAEQAAGGGGSIIDLGPLTPEEVGELATRLSPNITPATNRRLVEESDGNPFVALHYSRMIDPQTGELPDTVESSGEIAEAKLRGVGDLGRQLLAAASVIGRDFDQGDVQAASGRSDEETVRALDELLGMGVLHEGDDGSIDFTHDVVRHHVRESLSAVRRRLLHGRLAEHLTRGYRAAPEAFAGRLAHHLQEAGRFEEAAGYRVEAGDHARSIYAHQEAMTHYQSALALGHPDLTRIHMAIGDLHTLAGDYSAALESYRTASSRAEGVELARIEQRLGEVNGRLGRWELATHHFQAAVSGLEDPTQLTDAYIEWARVCHRMGAEDEARDAVAKAAAMADERVGSPPMVAIMEGLISADPEHGEIRARQGLAEARSRSSSAAEAAALTTLALLARRQGRLPDAIEQVEAALSLVKRIGDRHREATLHDLAADLFHEAGRDEEAMQQLTQAVELFAEVGTGGLEPAIWKIAPW